MLYHFTLLYDSETWTLSAAMEKRLESIEMWIYRCLLIISWTKVTNIAVKEKIKEAGGKEIRLMMELKKRKLAYCGHSIRAGGLQSQLLIGQMEGRRGRGRPRQT